MTHQISYFGPLPGGEMLLLVFLGNVWPLSMHDGLLKRKCREFAAVRDAAPLTGTPPRSALHADDFSSCNSKAQ